MKILYQDSEAASRADAYPTNFIRFLGTAGTRFIMLSQRRATGGIWFSYGGASGVIDPGPGSLVQICAARPSLDIQDARTLILTHKHLDHSCDINVLIEGMTLNHRREPRGTLLVTRDSLKDDPVVLRYVRPKLERIKRHHDGDRRKIAPGVSVESVVHAHHGVQCYGLIFRAKGLPSWGLISDSTYLPTFADRYRGCRMLVINTAIPTRFTPIDHMSLPDVVDLLKEIAPELVLLSHMGPKMLEMDEGDISRAASTDRSMVMPARDGMTIEIC